MTGHVHLTVDTLVNEGLEVTGHVRLEHMFLGLPLNSGEIPPVISIKDLLDTIPQ